MALHDPGAERIHRKLEGMIGEPEATLLRDRLVTRDEIRAVVREELRSELAVFEARVDAQIQRSARQQMLHFVAIMTFLNGMLGGVLTLALR